MTALHRDRDGGKTSVGAFSAGAGGLTYTQFTVLHRRDAGLVEGL